jgi:hypothetical protein
MSFHKQPSPSRQSQPGAYSQVLLRKGDTLTVNDSLTLLLTNWKKPIIINSFQ